MEQRPAIIDTINFRQMPEAAKSTIEAFVNQFDESLDGLFRIVVGLRNVWFWRYKLNEYGRVYLVFPEGQKSHPAYVVNRFDLKPQFDLEPPC